LRKQRNILADHMGRRRPFRFVVEDCHDSISLLAGLRRRADYIEWSHRCNCLSCSGLNGIDERL
jgi:hypothetical protein